MIKFKDPKENRKVKVGGGGKKKNFKLLVIVCTVQTFKCYMQDEIRTGLFLRGGTGAEGEGGGATKTKI